MRAADKRFLSTRPPLDSIIDVNMLLLGRTVGVRKNVLPSKSVRRDDDCMVFCMSALNVCLNFGSLISKPSTGRNLPAFALSTIHFVDKICWTTLKPTRSLELRTRRVATKCVASDGFSTTSPPRVLKENVFFFNFPTFISVTKSHTHFTAFVKPSMLSTWENIIFGALSASGDSLHTISSGISSNGGIVRSFFALGSACGSVVCRLTRS